MPTEEADDSSISEERYSEVRYLTDDRDAEVRHELVIIRGENGDLSKTAEVEPRQFCSAVLLNQATAAILSF